jgi:hypothetical protein
MITASVFLAVGLATIVLLVCDLVAGIGAAVVFAALVAGLTGSLWFLMPLRRGREAARSGSVEPL